VKIIKFDNSEKILKRIAALYSSVWNEDENVIIKRLEKHSTYNGFKAIIAMNDKEQIIGFAYGYNSLKGQYYRELLENTLTSEQVTYWLENCFEFVELAIHPFQRKKGIGRRLINLLLEDVANKTAILTTQQDNIPAKSLYRTLNWKVIKEPFLPNGAAGKSYVIMGMELDNNI
jgi:ribosomal protein S18 acetylase RimI-like enzyme